MDKRTSADCFSLTIDLMQKALMLFSILLGCAAANAQGVSFWNGSYEKGLKKAADENKLVFIAITGDQVPDCAYMIEELRTAEYVGADYNEHFVSLILDVDDQEEAELAKNYYIGTLPTWVWAGADGQALEIIGGRIGIHKFLRIGKDVRAGKVSEFVPSWQRYRDGERGHDFLAQYMPLLHHVNGNTDKILQEYRLAYLQGPQLLQRQEWEIFKLFLEYPEAPEFLYLEAHLEEFKAAFGEEDVVEVLRYTYQHAADIAAFAKDVEKLNAYTARMATYTEPKLVWTRRLYELRSMMLGTDVGGFIEKQLAFIAVSSPEKVADEYLFGAEWIARKAAHANPGHLKQALEWADLVVMRSDGTSGHYERALVLHAMGQDAKARASMAKAIEMAAENGHVKSYLEEVMAEW